MNKKTIIVILAIIILGAGGFYVALKQGTEEVKREKAEEKKALGLLASLKSGQEIECRIEAPEGNLTIRAKEENVRIDGISYLVGNAEGEQEGAGSFITVGEMFYMWSGDSGFKANWKKMEEFGSEGDEIENYRWEDMAQEWESGEYAYECRKVKLAGDIFTPPGEVVFQDLTALLDWTQDLNVPFEDKKTGDNKEEENSTLEDLEKQIDVYQDMNQEDIEKILEQMNINIESQP